MCAVSLGEKICREDSRVAVVSERLSANNIPAYFYKVEAKDLPANTSQPKNFNKLPIGAAFMPPFLVNQAFTHSKLNKNGFFTKT
jgi:hypothetical protein